MTIWRKESLCFRFKTTRGNLQPCNPESCSESPWNAPSRGRPLVSWPGWKQACRVWYYGWIITLRHEVSAGRVTQCALDWRVSILAKHGGVPCLFLQSCCDAVMLWYFEALCCEWLDMSVIIRRWEWMGKLDLIGQLSWIRWMDRTLTWNKNSELRLLFSTGERISGKLYFYQRESRPSAFSLGPLCVFVCACTA